MSKTIFTSLAIPALMGSILVFPSLGYVIKQFTNKKNKPFYIKQVFRRLEKQNLISTHEDPSGELTIKLTDQGKQRALTYKIETMKIKRLEKWDGIWRIVIFDIPEDKKQAREIFRQYLKKLEFYMLQKSVFVQAFPCKDEIDFLKHNFEIANFVTFIEAKSIDKQNLLRKDKVKETIKAYRGFLEGKKLSEAKVILPKIYKTLDKMAKVGFIKPNKANRLKSRLAKKLAKS